GLVTQHFLIFPSPGDAFLRAYLDLASLNIEARDIPNVHTATGPGAMRALWSKLDTASAGANEAEMTSVQKADWGYPQVVERVENEALLARGGAPPFGPTGPTPRSEPSRCSPRTAATYRPPPPPWMTWPASISAAPGAPAPP